MIRVGKTKDRISCDEAQMFADTVHFTKIANKQQTFRLLFLCLHFSLKIEMKKAPNRQLYLTCSIDKDGDFILLKCVKWR